MAEITKKGMDQGALYNYLNSIQTMLTELVTDLASYKTVVDEVVTDIGTIATFQAALTAKLDADTGVNDTDYASGLTEVVAPTAAAPAAMSASTPDLTSVNKS